MNKFEFMNEFKRLCMYFNSKQLLQDKQILALYYSKVKHMNNEQFKDKCNSFMNSNTFMPKISEFDKNKGARGHRGREYTEEFLESMYDI
ncbi:MAG: hypothetical protein RR585_10075 [Coprobacillus sp.]